MKTANPVLFGAACGTGVFLSSLFPGGGDLTGALLAALATGVIVALVLFIRNKRRG
ncbi:MAG TPA: hypothetical protein PKA03_03570 [Tabrizicola sp.]|nr:hypothetical protein [Tabrizicola sp.]HMS94294.1 hypothetical protein [Tabrizicola sp.]